VSGWKARRRLIGFLQSLKRKFKRKDFLVRRGERLKIGEISVNYTSCGGWLRDTPFSFHHDTCRGRNNQRNLAGAKTTILYETTIPEAAYSSPHITELPAYCLHFGSIRSMIPVMWRIGKAPKLEQAVALGPGPCKIETKWVLRLPDWAGIGGSINC
jgi:hypothetical protein